MQGSGGISENVFNGISIPPHPKSQPGKFEEQL
jgi:hypothetical protein